jgi:hypothetical protein
VNNRGRLVVDVGIAVVVAALALILTSGLGVVAIIVGVVAVLCAISFGVTAIVRRVRGQPVLSARRRRRSRGPRG